MSKANEKQKASEAGVRVHGLHPGQLSTQRKRPASTDHSKLIKLDPIIHERARLAILTSLSTSEDGCCLFTDLRDSLQVTDGNLITHLRTLEQAGLVERKKEGAGRNSATKVMISKKGRNAFKAYLDQLEMLVQAARKGA